MMSSSSVRAVVTHINSLILLEKEHVLQRIKDATDDITKESNGLIAPLREELVRVQGICPHETTKTINEITNYHDYTEEDQTFCVDCNKRLDK